VAATFVVEGKTRIGAAQRPRAGGQGHGGRRRGQRQGLPTAVGDGNAQRLRHVQRGFVVHVFVQERKTVEVQRLRVVLRGQKVQRAGEDLGHFGAGAVCIGQGQLPALQVRDPAGVVERISVRAQRRRAAGLRVGLNAARALAVAADPVVLEPADVAQFPQRRVQRGPQGTASPRSASAASYTAKVARVSRRLSCKACRSAAAPAWRIVSPRGGWATHGNSCATHLR
jgi:hypothetical protein